MAAPSAGRPPAPSVVVVGGGIAGLAAAVVLRREGPADLRLTVVEGSGRFGGKLATEELAGLPTETAAESFLTEPPDAVELARSVGLGSALVPPATTAASLWVGNRLRALPARTLLGVPADLRALARSRVLPTAALARVAADGLLPSRPLHADVAVGRHVASRMGPAVVDRLVDPLLGGVYAGRAEDLSLAATMPGLAAQLAAGGSLRRAAGRVLQQGGSRRFVTVRGGLRLLVDALLRTAGGRQLSGRPAVRLTRRPDGWRVMLGPAGHGEELTADGVVLAVPAPVAGRLLADTSPAAAAGLSTIPYASVATIILGYPAGRVPPVVAAGSGVLVPAGAGRTVKAVTFLSTKWPDLRGGELTLLRCSVGRFGDPDLRQLADAELTAAAAADLRDILGLVAAPVLGAVHRWGGALPQYTVGHPQRVAGVQTAVDRLHTLGVCGAAYQGVGLPACVRSARSAARRVLDGLSDGPRGN